MTEPEFEDCFKGWLALHPFKKNRDWPAGMGDVYFQELGNYRVVELKEALGRLHSKVEDFPSIKRIKEEIGSGAARSDKEPEGMPHLTELAADLNAEIWGLDYTPHDVSAELRAMWTDALGCAREAYKQFVAEGSDEYAKYMADRAGLARLFRLMRAL